VILTEVCNSIEGERLYFQTRQFNVMVPRLDETIGGLVYPFKLGISSKAVIEEELNPKNPKFRPESVLDKDTCLKGETIEGFTLKAIKDTKMIHKGAHKGTAINPNCFAYAHIEIGFRALLQKKRKEDPQKPPD
jgi:hypothetical protein